MLNFRFSVLGFRVTTSCLNASEGKSIFQAHVSVCVLAGLWCHSLLSWMTALQCKIFKLNPYIFQFMLVLSEREYAVNSTVREPHVRFSERWMFSGCVVAFQGAFVHCVLSWFLCVLFLRNGCILILIWHKSGLFVTWLFLSLFVPRCSYFLSPLCQFNHSRIWAVNGIREPILLIK